MEEDNIDAEAQRGILKRTQKKTIIVAKHKENNKNETKAPS